MYESRAQRDLKVETKNLLQEMAEPNQPLKDRQNDLFASDGPL